MATVLQSHSVHSPRKPRCHESSRIAWAKPRARVGEEFSLQCPNCGGDIRLIAFITEPGSIPSILRALGKPLEPAPLAPARGSPTDCGELVQVHDDREVFQVPDSRTAHDRYPRAAGPLQPAGRCPDVEKVCTGGEKPMLPRGCRGRGRPAKTGPAFMSRGQHAPHRPSNDCGRTVDCSILQSPSFCRYSRCSSFVSLASRLQERFKTWSDSWYGR